jgi:hypothetical protein
MIELALAQRRWGIWRTVMTAIEAQLIERLKKLQPGRVAAAAQRLTEGLARLDALERPAVTEDEVEAEIKAARQERRARQDA